MNVDSPLAGRTLGGILAEPFPEQIAHYLDDVRRFLKSHPHAPDGNRSALPSITEQIAQRIRHMIREGEFLPGERLLEVNLANRFAVSRGPVREALLMLARDGLVEITPRRGVVVFDPSEQDIAQLYEIRGVLFGVAAKAAARASDRSFVPLALKGVKLLKQAAPDTAIRAKLYMQVRTALGALVLTAAANPRLNKIVIGLDWLAVTHMRSFDDAARRVEAARIWNQIVDAIAKADAEAAAERARHLIETAMLEIMRLTKARKPPSPVS